MINAAGRIPFAFLEDIHGRFMKKYGRACHTALACAMNEEFSRVLSQQMDYYSNDPNDDRMNRIKGEMCQVELACCLLLYNFVNFSPQENLYVNIKCVRVSVGELSGCLD